MNFTLAIFPLLIAAAGSRAERIQFSDSFESMGALNNWIIEKESAKTSVVIKNGAMEWKSDSRKKGLVVWCKSKMNGNVRIVYDRHIYKDQRVADMNQFWMATEKGSDGLSFTRNGTMSSYDNLTLYYCGLGVWNNTHSRFRRYNGSSPRPSPVDNPYTIKGNTTYHIELIVNDNYTQVYSNGKMIFDIKDNNPYKTGYFAFRALGNHERVDNFTIYNMDDNATSIAAQRNLSRGSAAPSLIFVIRGRDTTPYSIERTGLLQSQWVDLLGRKVSENTLFFPAGIHGGVYKR